MQKDVVRIKTTGLHTAEVSVNGLDIANVTTSVSVHAERGNVPRVELGLINPFEFEGGARVEIPSELRTALIALGWTAPAEDD